MSFYKSNIITFRFIISILFILEIVCVFGYTSSIYFFFIFFLICYIFFSNLIRVSEITKMTQDIRSLFSQLNSILNLIKYKKSILLSFLFLCMLFKTSFYNYKVRLYRFSSKIYNKIVLDFLFKYTFISN